MPFLLFFVGIALILLMLTKTMTLILTYVGLLAFDIALLIPTLATLASRRSNTEIGTALGLQTAAGTLGQFAGPSIGGLLFIWSIHIPYIVAAVPLLASAFYLVVKAIMERNRPGFLNFD